ncbi:MAG: HEAT repeat domain-containing protein [Fimbriimonadaceae bacterium]|nr:HEAT repeat domain-containing protein [Fimbriimonadaceae bacterium]
MSIFCLALSLLQQQDPQGSPAPVDTVSLGGREIPVTWPTDATPLTGVRAEMGQSAFPVDSSGNLLVREALGDPWDAAKQAFERARERKAEGQMSILVMLETRCTILERGPDRVFRERQSSFSVADEDEATAAVARFSAMVRGATGGVIDPKIQFRIDDDINFVFLDRPATVAPDGTEVTMDVPPEDDLFGIGHVANAIAPYVNQAPFEAEDGQNWGPFAAVLVVHTGPIKTARTYKVGDTPVTLIPAYSAGGPLGATLASRLFEAWRAQILGGDASKAADRVRPDAAESIGLAAAALRKSTLRTGAGESAATALSKLPVGQPYSASGGAIVREGGSALVRMDAVELAPGSATWTSWRPGPDGWRLETDASPFEGTDVEAFRLSPTGDIGNPARTTGSFSLDETDNATPLRVVAKGSRLAGHAVLLRAGPGESLARPGEEKTLAFDFTVSANEDLAVQLVGASGRVLASVLISGQTEAPGEAGPPVFVGRPETGSTTRSVTLPLSQLNLAEPVYEVRLSTPEGSFIGERATRGPVEIGFAKIAVRASEPSDALLPAWEPIGRAYPSDVEVTEPVFAELKRILANPEGPDTYAALDVFRRVKDPRIIGELKERAASGRPSVAFLATKALAAQDSPEAWAALRALVETGPFEFNRRVAAGTFINHPEAEMAASLNMLGARGWRTREAAARALAKIETEPAGIILAATLFSEPHPSVRRVVCQGANPNIDLASRRVLYAAVNDASEWVRAVAYVTMLDAPAGPLRDDALKGVRDPSVNVRLSLLQAIKTRQNDGDRAALRLAVIDPETRVRVAALEALATQPGPVVLEEVQNLTQDSDPRVAQALQDLARKKGIKLP